MPSKSPLTMRFMRTELTIRASQQNPHWIKVRYSVYSQAGGGLNTAQKKFDIRTAWPAQALGSHPARTRYRVSVSKLSFRGTGRGGRRLENAVHHEE